MWNIMPSEHHLRLMYFIGFMYLVFLGVKDVRLESYSLSNRELGQLQRIIEIYVIIIIIKYRPSSLFGTPTLPSPGFQPLGLVRPFGTALHFCEAS